MPTGGGQGSRSRSSARGHPRRLGQSSRRRRVARAARPLAGEGQEPHSTRWIGCRGAGYRRRGPGKRSRHHDRHGAIEPRPGCLGLKPAGVPFGDAPLLQNAMEHEEPERIVRVGPRDSMDNGSAIEATVGTRHVDLAERAAGHHRRQFDLDEGVGLDIETDVERCLAATMGWHPKEAFDGEFRRQLVEARGVDEDVDVTRTQGGIGRISLETHQRAPVALNASKARTTIGCHPGISGSRDAPEAPITARVVRRAWVPRNSGRRPVGRMTSATSTCATSQATPAPRIPSGPRSRTASPRARIATDAWMTIARATSRRIRTTAR